MFSDHLPKIDHASYKTLFGIAAGLVIVCQLVAMAMVADGQVKKAEARDAQFHSTRLAIARCIETAPGAVRHNCIQQAGADMPVAQALYSTQKVDAMADASSRGSDAVPANGMQDGTRSFMRASFATR